MMIRTQVQFTKEQWQALKNLASARHISIAELVRQSVDQMIQAPENRDDDFRRLALEIVGKYSAGEADVSANHDKYLAEIYGS
jgi:predicted DNA-binding ribbon-helix-helix protein